MFRRFICILSVTGMVLALRLPVYAGETQYHVALPEHFCADITVCPAVISEKELPETGDYPAPIFTAMVLSLGAVILMVLTENRKK